MDKISTSELIRNVAEATGVSQVNVKKVIGVVADQISGHVANGTEVAFTGLGKFCPRDRKARVMISPLDKKEKEIPAKRVLSFKASKKA